MDKAKPKNVSLTLWIPLILALLVFGAYRFLPFISQPELGATTISVLTESRSNNELGVITNGLILMPIAASVLFLLGLWNFANHEVNRTTAAVTALMGVIMLEYYVVFAQDYMQEEATYLSSMSIGFWVLLILGILMVLQVFLPRSTVEQEFKLTKMIANQESAIIIALVALILIVGISNPRYLATRNILDVLQGNAYIAVAAIGMSMVIITGNIDISVGSLIGLLAIVSGRLVVGGWVLGGWEIGGLMIGGWIMPAAPIWVAWIVPLILGAAIGAFIGFLVTYLRVPSIVVTLGMLSILKGLLIMWTSGQRVTDMPDGYLIAQMKPFGISTPIYFMIILTILAAVWMRYSGLGRSFYAIGGNAEAARLSGLSERRIIMQVFMINGVFAGIASVLYATQLSIIQATPPPSLELFVITAAVVGGVSILGGKGTVIGATLAAILLNAIRSGMIFIDVSPFWIQAVQGALILITVLIDLIRRKRQRL
ncbi:MAG: ABC transporter permease [Anaerolineae bacterium]|nr:ABC transporter permease [Anaerolineae bacterium]